jgi:hypothetical protein
VSFSKLTADDAAAYDSEYVAFLKSLRPGQAGRANLTAEGVATKITMKRRLQRAAEIANVELRFHRSARDEVVFEVVSAPERRRRPNRSAKKK